MTLGELLKSYRQRALLSQEELAERANLSPRAISEIERGRQQSPRHATVRQLVAALGLTGAERTAFEALAAGGAPAPPATPAPPHRLPHPLTPFIGREREVDDLRERLLRPATRLLTLRGPGGAGKTRLAIRIAEEARGEFADGVFFVALATVASADLVIPAIAQTLAVRESPGQTLADSLATIIGDRRLLLVLDNLEHLTAVGTALAALLAACPALTILATSRVTLRISGEQTHAVPQLSIPPADRQLTPAQLRAYEAVALFIARAQEVREDFALDAANAASVAQIVGQLDGLPLAIELAAARVRVLSPQQLLARLDNRLAFLTGGPHDLPARQQTVRATLDWSYNLLGMPEQRTLQRLAVFPAGATLAAAEALGDPTAGVYVIDTISALVDNSLLRQVEDEPGEVRFRMLETVREYALARLAENAEAADVYRRCAQYYHALTTEAAPGIRGPEQLRWLRRLDAESDNLRAVLERLLTEGDPSAAVAIGWRIWWFWFIRGHFTEGQRWMERAAAADLTAPERSRAETIIAAMSFARGAHERAATLLDANIPLARAADDRVALATALLARGNVALPRGEFALAVTCAHEGSALFQALGNPYDAGFALICAVHAALLTGDLADATRVLDEAERLLRASGSPFGLVSALNVRAILAQTAGDYPQTIAVLHEAILLSQALRDTFAVFYGLLSLAGALVHLGAGERAARIFGAADAHRTATGTINAYGTSQALYEQQLATLRAQFDPATLATLHREGRAMTLDQAIAYALAGVAAMETGH